MPETGAIATRQQLIQAAMRRHPAGTVGPRVMNPRISPERTREIQEIGRRSAAVGSADGSCPCCDGRGWVRAVMELPLEIACPTCGVVSTQEATR